MGLTSLKTKSRGQNKIQANKFLRIESWHLQKDTDVNHLYLDYKSGILKVKIVE